MHGLTELLGCLDRFQQKYGKTCQAAKVLSCGGMTGSALLLPISEAEGHLWCSMLLSIFMGSAVVWHTLHLDCFVHVGPYTVPLACTILIVAILPAGASRTELIPWLLLFAVVMSLTTVASSVILKRFEAQSSRQSSHEMSSRSSNGSVIVRVHRWLFPEEVIIGHMGPTSHYSGHSSHGTTITLSNGPPNARPSGDPRLIGFCPSLVIGAPGRGSRSVSPDSNVASPEPLSSYPSDDIEAGSTAPLLGHLDS